jgi:hypothetical protein
MYEEAGRMFEW